APLIVGSFEAAALAIRHCSRQPLINHRRPQRRPKNVAGGHDGSAGFQCYLDRRGLRRAADPAYGLAPVLNCILSRVPCSWNTSTKKCSRKRPEVSGMGPSAHPWITITGG